MRDLELRLLGERVVYPGHPAVLALLILEAFPQIEDAFVKGLEYSGALESSDVPGAGGNVYSGLAVVRRVLDGMPAEESLRLADEAWAYCDSQRDSPKLGERWRAGQAQADRIKPALRQRLAELVAEGSAGT